MLGNGVQTLAGNLPGGELLTKLTEARFLAAEERRPTVWELGYQLAVVHLRLHGPFAEPRCTESPCELEGLSLGVMELVHACFLLEHEFYEELCKDWKRTLTPIAARGVPYFSYALQLEHHPTRGRPRAAVMQAATQQLRAAGIKVKDIPKLLSDGMGDRGELARVKARLRGEDVRTFRSHSGVRPTTKWPASIGDKKDPEQTSFFIP